MKKESLPNPDNLPEFTVPKELTRLLEECSHNGQYITFLRTPDGIKPLVNFSDDIEMSGVVQWVVSWALSVLQVNSQNVSEQVLGSLLPPEEEEEE